MTAFGRPSPGPAKRRSRGFTLIELTLVTLLVLILAGLSAPLFRKTLSNLSARDTSFNICKLINYAQEMAVLERKNYKMVFDFNDGRYQLFELSSSEKLQVYKKAAGRFGRLFRVPRGIKLGGEKNSAVFYPDGHCDEIGIDLSTHSGGYSIAVNGFGNTARIKEVNVGR